YSSPVSNGFPPAWSVIHARYTFKNAPLTNPSSVAHTPVSWSVKTSPIAATSSHVVGTSTPRSSNQSLRYHQIGISQLWMTRKVSPLYLLHTSLRSEEHTSELQSRENLVC